MNLRFRLAVTSLVFVSSVLAACDHSASPTSAATAASPEVAKTPATTGAPESTTSSSGTAVTGAPSTDPSGAPPDAAMAAKARDAWSDLVQRLSEPDASFFSDNIISNETSYLQIGASLPAKAKAGGAYIGVGPEQNFTYIAMTRPQLAFVVDIRRQNMLLHLLYKSIFEEATSRSHFLTLLIGRPHEAASDPGPNATIEAVMTHAEKLPKDEATFAKTHARLMDRIERDYKIALDTKDKKNIELMHRSFLRDQLDIRFELKEKNGRKYPTLKELLATADPNGNKLGFLASEAPFRLLQTMEREHRIIPVVGDFAGDRAMPGVAAHIVEQKLTVSAFYVSNVEQYLFENNVWAKWTRNIAALPSDDSSLFIRAYLDQGRKHPSQLNGHRTATVLQKMADFKARPEKKPFQNFWQVTTEGVL